MQLSSLPVTTQTSSPSACLSFLSSSHSVHLSSPLLSLTCSHYKGAQMPQISSTDLLQQKGDPRGIRLTNHCLKPLWAHRPRDKDSRELYSALAGISGCLCWDWQARLFLRWKIAAGQPTASCISISQTEKVPAQSVGRAQRNVTSELAWCTLHSRLTRRQVSMHNNCHFIVF